MTDAAVPHGGPLNLNSDRAREILRRSLDRPQVARVYDAFLGGSANYAMDRELATKVKAELPNVDWVAKQNRKFLGNAVRYMVQQGVRQFLDLGSGLPTVGNVHEEAEKLVPGECRVVYMDNDPVVAAHSHLLLERSGYLDRHMTIEMDAMDRYSLMGAIEDHTSLDLTQPIGLLCVAFLHFIPNEQQPQDVVQYYRDSLAPGSYLGLSHLTRDGLPPEGQKRLTKALKLYENTGSPVVPRDREEILRLLGEQDGWELVTPPGLCWTSEWRTDADEMGGSGLVDGLEAWESLIAVGVSRKQER